MKAIKTILCALFIPILGLSLTGCFNSKYNIKYNILKNTQKSDNQSVELTISAAASLKEVMADIETEYSLSHPEIKLTFNFGSSGSLQKQIEQGAPCDLFI